MELTDFSATRGKVASSRRPAFFPAGRGISPSHRSLRLEQILPNSFQILPFGIHGSDQLYFPAAPPTLDLFFTIDCSIGINELFVIDQLSQVVAAGESCDELALVLPYTPDKIACNTRIEDRGFRPVCHDVYEKEFASHGPFLLHTACACL